MSEQEQQNGANIEKGIKRCLELKILLEAAQDAYRDCIESVSEKNPDYDKATIRAMTEKAYAKTYNSEKYEKEKARIEAVYDIVETLD